MIIHHFESKSTARRSLKWLHAAAADALSKQMSCFVSGSMAHENMWSCIAQKYSAEITRREARANKRAA